MANVPFLDLRAAYAEMQSNIDAAVARVLTSGWYIGGGEVSNFEHAFADYCSAKHCISVGNGLDALHLSIRALGIGTGDEVIVASNSFIATLLAVTLAGATPILVEPDPKTRNLNPDMIAPAISKRTKAILPTHLYGVPADIDAINAIAREHGLFVIEDAAQAHGARYKNERIGAQSDLVCWSFYPTKNLGALGDGGAVTTNDTSLALKIRALANYGSATKRYVSEVRGVNSRLDPIQAAVLSAKLPQLDAWNKRRAEVAAIYSEELGNAGIILPQVPDWADPSWYVYVIETRQRDRLQAQLSEAGIETLIHYPVPPHLQGAYKDLGYPKGAFPIAERLADTVLSLPIGPHLTESDVAQVVEAVRACFDA